ncbi:MAG: TIGR03546 family protein [Planctomycetes bacterium]|nr:TIGR03546 family protein [Planctomycetota bacterium]
MFVLTLTRKLYKVLSSDTSPSAIAFAVAFGVLAGCVPVLSGLALFMLLLVLVFRVQVAAALLAWGLTRLAVVAGLARVFEGLGESLLEAEPLKPFWTWASNAKGLAWFGLDTYAICGGAVVGLLLGAALFLPVRWTVAAYRRWAHEKVSKNRFFQWLTSFWVIKILRFIFVGAGVG